jgi:hypothetical protein
VIWSRRQSAASGTLRNLTSLYAQNVILNGENGSKLQ